MFDLSFFQVLKQRRAVKRIGCGFIKRHCFSRNMNRGVYHKPRSVSVRDIKIPNEDDGMILIAGFLYDLIDDLTDGILRINTGFFGCPFDKILLKINDEYRLSHRSLPPLFASLFHTIRKKSCFSDEFPTFVKLSLIRCVKYNDRKDVTYGPIATLFCDFRNCLSC